MADLRVRYMGFDLKNPIIAGSSTLTENLAGLKDLEKYGASAVVLKSLFEEEIIMELEQNKVSLHAPGHIYPEIFDHFDFADVEDTVTKYLFLIEDAKKALSIPVIASINCVSSHEWPIFAKRLEEAGADGLELNLFILPSDFDRSSEENENTYFEVISKVRKEVHIPIALKVSYYFTNLGTMLQRLSQTGISALVLFNRFFSPDFDIENFRVIPSNIYSSPSELTISLRWIAIMAERVKCDLAASTGIHDGSAIIKQLLAGANAVQLASTLYKNGIQYIETMLKDIEKWMDEHNFHTINEFRGKMSQAKSLNPASLERSQFMRHFSGKVL